MASGRQVWPEPANFAGYSCCSGRNVPINHCRAPIAVGVGSQSPALATLMIFNRFSRHLLLRRLASPAVAVFALACGGCAMHTERGFVIFGDWSIGARRTTDKCGCGAGRVHAGRCRGESGSCGQCGDETTAPENVPAPQPAENGPPPERPAHAARQKPPASVHGRFHPVPTRPVFGGPVLMSDPAMEPPGAYSARPSRMRATPSPPPLAVDDAPSRRVPISPFHDDDPPMPPLPGAAP
jgi:hypothetical protein